MTQHFLLLHGLQKLQGHSTGQRTSAKSCAVHAGLNTSCDFLAHQQRAQRQPAGDRLGDSDKVRLDSIMLVSEPAASASQTALDFVRDQQCVMFARETLRCLDKSLAQRTDSAFTLHKLKANRANGVIKAALQVGNIVELYEVDAGKPRLKWRAIFFLVRGGKRAESASVECVFKRKDAPLGSFTV